jgi:N-ethylmaleimide reductase
MTDLFTPFDLGGLSLPNRVVMAPMTRARAGNERRANALMGSYYAQRAEAGLIVSEATVISSQGIGWPCSPAIASDEQATAWSDHVVNPLHAAGGRIAIQLWHCGRASHSVYHQGRPPVAPSAIAISQGQIHTPHGKLDYETPHALTIAEITATIDDYRHAARRARQAGFDALELHGANGYLIDQFLQSRTNQRNDAYGGDVARRCRFLDEVLAAVLESWPAERIGVRLSPNGVFNDMGSPDFRETFTHAASVLSAHKVGFLHVVDGLAFGFHGLGEPVTLSEARSCFGGVIIGNCGYTLASANEQLASGAADLIAFGRPFIGNPDLVARLRHGWPLAEAPMAVWYSHDPKGYADWPTYQGPSTASH